MRYRQMGKWGVKVSGVGLGSYLTIGMTCDEATARGMVRKAYERGINYFDTANAYARGAAELTLGRCLAEFPRSDLVVLNKAYAPMGEGPNDRGLSAKHIREQCEASLKRLGMDYIDIYLCHRADPAVPLEETLRALEDLLRAGKILYWGVSEWPATRIVAANALARELGVRPMAVSQPRYNLLFRHPEYALFPTTAAEGIGNVTFSPLAHGMLTAKYKPGEAAPAGTRAADPRQNAVMKNMYWTEENKAKAQTLAAIASELGLAAAELALAWCLASPHVTSVILGTSSGAQLEQDLKAVDVKVPPEVMAKLDALFPCPKVVSAG